MLINDCRIFCSLRVEEVPCFYNNVLQIFTVRLIKLNVTLTLMFISVTDPLQMFQFHFLKA